MNSFENRNKYLLLADGKSPHTLKWLKELIKYFDVYLISLNGVSNDLYKYIDKTKVYVLNNRVNELGGNYKLIFKLNKIRNIIKKIKPKYLNAHYLSSYGFLAALSKNILDDLVLIQSTWGSDILVEPFLNNMRKFIAKYSLRKANFITADSWHMADVIIKLVGKKDIIVFPFGINNIENYKYKKEKIIFSNRALKKLYNIDITIKWFSKQSKDYKLIIANDGIEKDNLKNLVKSLKLENRVLFVGYLSYEAQKKIYQKAKYYISIPESDSTSVSLLEAMKYGCIPIVSNIPVNREWILDGINGVFFDINKNLREIVVEENFFDINKSLLNKKAIFSKSIKKFVKKVKNEYTFS